MALATMRNYDPFQSPTHFKMVDLLRKFDKSFGVTGRNYGKVTGDRTIEDIQKRRADRWNFLFVAGMSFSSRPTSRPSNSRKLCRLFAERSSATHTAVKMRAVTNPDRTQRRTMVNTRPGRPLDFEGLDL